MGDLLAILDRRKNVFRLRMMGLTEKALATATGVSLRTIEEDVAWLKINAKRFVKEFDEDLDIAETIGRLEELKIMLWERYLSASSDAEGEKVKLFIITKIQDLEKQIEQLKINTGLWSSQGERVPVDDTSYEARIIKLREKRKLSLSPANLIEEKIKSGQGNGTDKKKSKGGK